MTMYIYSIEFANGSKYVGKTNNFARRWEEHKKGNGCPATRNQDFTGARFILESTERNQKKKNYANMILITG